MWSKAPLDVRVQAGHVTSSQLFMSLTPPGANPNNNHMHMSKLYNLQSGCSDHPGAGQAHLYITVSLLCAHWAQSVHRASNQSLHTLVVHPGWRPSEWTGPPSSVQASSSSSSSSSAPTSSAGSAEVSGWAPQLLPLLVVLPLSLLLLPLMLRLQTNRIINAKYA